MPNKAKLGLEMMAIALATHAVAEVAMSYDFETMTADDALISMDEAMRMLSQDAENWRAMVRREMHAKR